MTELRGTIGRGDRLGGAWVRIVAGCLGTAGGLHLAGMVGLYQAILDPLPRTAILVVAVALMAAGVGPWVPQRLIARRLRRASRADWHVGTSIRWDLLPHPVTASQQGLLWVVLAVTCLAAGTTALIFLWATGPIDAACRWLSERFFLSFWELLASDLLAVTAAVAVPWALLGLAVACLYALAASEQPPGRAGGGLAGALLVGVALGLAVSPWELLRTSPGRTALVGALPLFIAAALSVTRAGKRRPLDAENDSRELGLPEWAPEGGYALLATLLAWGILVGTDLAIWPRVVSRILPIAKPLVAAWFALWLGGGVVLGGALARRSDHPAGGCGPAMVLAGLASAVALGGGALAARLDGVAEGASSGLVRTLMMTSLAVAGLGAGGAFPYLKRALIVQSGSPIVASTQVLTASLLGAAVGATVGPGWIVPGAGTLVALVVASLLVLAAGGLLVIFDVGGPARHRTWRLVGVFVALLALMIGLPRVSRRWLWPGSGVTAVREGPWLTLSLTGEPEGPSVLAVEPSRTSPPAADSQTIHTSLHAVLALRNKIDRCWLISTGELTPRPSDVARCRSIEIGCYDPLAAAVSRGQPAAGEARVLPERSPVPALRALRWTHGRSDVIVLCSAPGGHPANAAIWSVETFHRARRCLAPRGILAALVRPADYGRADLAILAATFAVAMPEGSHAGLIGEGPGQVLAFVATTSPSSWLDWQASARAGMGRVGPIKSFLRVAGPVRPNSLRAISLSGRGDPGSGGLQLTEYVSQAADWRSLPLTSLPLPLWPPESGPRRSSVGPPGAPAAQDRM